VPGSQLGVPFDPLCRQNKDATAVERRRSRLGEPHVKEINALVEELRRERDDDSIPYVDPDSGGVNARVLVLKQDPGPKSLPGTGSGMLSWANDDPAASTFAAITGEVGLPWSYLVPWNAIPWKPSNNSNAAEKQAGRLALVCMVTLLTRVDAVLLHGDKAQEAWTKSVATHPELRRITPYSTFHTARRGITHGSNQTAAEGRAHIEATFRAIIEHLQR